LNLKVSKENLNRIFENSGCLSEQQLFDYNQNKLSNKERNLVERHSINCKFCSDALDGFELVNATEENYFEAKNYIPKAHKSNYLKTIFIGVAASLIVALLIKNFLDFNKDMSAENKNQYDDIVTEEKKANEILIYDSVPAVIENSNACTTDSVADFLEKEPKEFKLKENSLAHSASTPKPKQLEELNSYNRTNEIQIDELEEEQEDIIDEEIDAENLEFNAPTLSIESNDINFKPSQTNEGNEVNDKTTQKNKAIGIDKERRKQEERAIQEKEELANKRNEIVKSAEQTAIKKEFDSTGIILSQTQIRESRSKLDAQADNQTALETKTTVEFDIKQGIYLFNHKSFEQAINYLSNIPDTNTDYQEAQLYIGKSYIALQRTNEAKPHLTKALNGSEIIKSEAQKLLDSIK